MILRLCSLGRSNSRSRIATFVFFTAQQPHGVTCVPQCVQSQVAPRHTHARAADRKRASHESTVPPIEYLNVWYIDQWKEDTCLACCFQVFNKILTLAALAAVSKLTSNTWSNLVLSTNSVRTLTHLILAVIQLIVNCWAFLSISSVFESNGDDYREGLSDVYCAVGVHSRHRASARLVRFQPEAQHGRVGDQARSFVNGNHEIHCTYRTLLWPCLQYC